MPEIPWDELTALTTRLEKLCGDRMTARCIGSDQLRDQFQTQIDDLRERRKRLIDRLSNCFAARSHAPSLTN
jgi:hypothetical protein